MKTIYGTKHYYRKYLRRVPLRRTRAEEYLVAELQNLRELRDAGVLCYGDLETACAGLGLDFDYTDYFCRALSLN